LVQQAVAIDAVDGVRAQFAGFDKRLDRVDQIEALVFEIIGGCGWEHEQRRPVMAVGDEWHFHVQVRAIPGSCAAFHCGPFVGDQGWRYSRRSWPSASLGVSLGGSWLRLI